MDMSASGDKLPPTEWLFTRFTAVSPVGYQRPEDPAGR